MTTKEKPAAGFLKIIFNAKHTYIQYLYTYIYFILFTVYTVYQRYLSSINYFKVLKIYPVVQYYQSLLDLVSPWSACFKTGGLIS